MLLTSRIALLTTRVPRVGHKVEGLPIICGGGGGGWPALGPSQGKSLHTSCCLNRKQAARYRVTLKQDKPLTYEMANPPYTIAHEKSWNSWNTSNLLDGVRGSETATEDFFIRKFMAGTWHRLFISELIIKRRGNLVIVGGIVVQAIHPRKMYFLLGYSEEMLSCILKCPVKLEIQSLADKREMIFKYV